MELVISGAIANFNAIKSEEFLKKLLDKVSDIELYKFNPTPGRIYNAAFDWKIIGNISAILGILGFVWEFYDKEIAPKKEKDSNSGIVIMFNNYNTTNNIWIGNDVKTKAEFEQRITPIIDSLVKEKLDEEVDSIRNSQNWKQVSKH